MQSSVALVHSSWELKHIVLCDQKERKSVANSELGQVACKRKRRNIRICADSESADGNLRLSGWSKIFAILFTKTAELIQWQMFCTGRFTRH